MILCNTTCALYVPVMTNHLTDNSVFIQCNRIFDTYFVCIHMPTI